MSDQVVFTKEEVAIIKATIGLTGELDALVARTLGVVSPNTDTIKKVLSLLDSPRPRPKVSIELLRDIQAGKWADKEVKEYFAHYGFDIED